MSHYKKGILQNENLMIKFRMIDVVRLISKFINYKIRHAGLNPKRNQNGQNQAKLDAYAMLLTEVNATRDIQLPIFARSPSNAANSFI